MSLSFIKGGLSLSDYIPKPTVKTTIRIGGFTLLALAYRTLTPAECRLAAEMYRNKFKVKKFPASGSATIVTFFGVNPADDL